MKSDSNDFEPLAEAIEKYVSTSIELTRLKMLDSGVRMSTNVVSRLIVIAMFFFFATFLNLGIGVLLGKWLGDVYLGFFALAGFYLLLAIILHFFLHRWIKRPLSDYILSRIIE